MQFKTLNNNLIAYNYRSGTGPTLVFANSLGSDQSIWDEVIAALPAHFAVLTYDLRGHGASGRSNAPASIDLLAEDLCALVDHLDLRDIILCGVSIGGMIAQAVATKRADLTRGAILSNTALKIGTDARWNARITDVQAQGLAGIADLIMDQWFSAPFQNAYPDALAGYKAMLLRNDPTAYTNTCAALRDADLSASSQRITAPCVCIAGGMDRSVPAELVQNLARAIDGATLATLPHAGHLPCIDAPQDVAKIILEMRAQCASPMDRKSAGMAVRRRVLGASHVDLAESKKTDFDVAFQSLITEGAWGTVWASDAISYRERSMITLALLAALGNFDEIPMHIRATARTGASMSDVTEAFQHVAIYAGVPRANHAIKLAKQTFAEMESSHDT